MCGILGTIPKTEDAIFLKSLKKLSHRGPDGINFISNSHISLGHTRLSIIDLSNSAVQPMKDQTGRFELVFNGEIYNYLELRKELEFKGYTFKSTGDAEVLLYAFIEWKEKCLLMFNGMWSFAIWDNEEKSLFLSRDRFGKKPLFYAFVGKKFIFGSEMKAIMPFLNEVKPSSEFHWMSENIFGYESTQKCLIEGIKRFPHGHFGYLRNDDLKISRYWNTLDHLAKPSLKYEDQVEEFRDIFTDACKLRMRADVSLGTALSGGLDSSSTFAMMCDLWKKDKSTKSTRPPTAFVASFPGSNIDESEYAKKVINHTSSQGVIHNISPDDAWKNLFKDTYLFEELYLTSPVPMMELYRNVKSRGVSVTLDGHGADEMFSGYGHIVEALWDIGIDSNKRKDLFEILGSDVIKSSHTLFYIKFMLKKYRNILLKKDLLSKDSTHPGFVDLDNLSKHLYVIFHESILPTLLRNYDRYSMANGVEIRMPFMDHRLVSYVFSLPLSSKVDNGFTKRIVRDAISPLLPHEISYRKSKIGFNTPLVEWMQGPLKNYFEDTVESLEFLNCDILKDPADLKARVHAITSKKSSSWLDGEKVWMDLNPFIWSKAFLKQEGAI